MKHQTITSHSEIEAILNDLSIKRYKILADGTVDVTGSVILRNRDFTLLPVKFGHVAGCFDCEGCRNLMSIDGLPYSVGAYLDLRDSPIVSLDGFNTSVGTTCYINGSALLSGGISLILADPTVLCITGTSSTQFVKHEHPLKIIQRYVGRREDIFECQAELIDVGYAAYAKL